MYCTNYRTQCKKIWNHKNNNISQYGVDINYLVSYITFLSTSKSVYKSITLHESLFQVKRLKTLVYKINAKKKLTKRTVKSSHLLRPYLTWDRTAAGSRRRPRRPIRPAAPAASVRLHVLFVFALNVSFFHKKLCYIWIDDTTWKDEQKF